MKTLRFKSSVLFGTYDLLDNSLRALQLPTHPSNLTANGYKCNYWLDSLGCKLTRIGSMSHIWLLKDTQFAWLVALLTLANKSINIFLINQTLFHIISYYF